MISRATRSPDRWSDCSVVKSASENALLVGRRDAGTVVANRAADRFSLVGQLDADGRSSPLRARQRVGRVADQVHQDLLDVGDHDPDRDRSGITGDIDIDRPGPAGALEPAHDPGDDLAKVDKGGACRRSPEVYQVPPVRPAVPDGVTALHPVSEGRVGERVGERSRVARLAEEAKDVSEVDRRDRGVEIGLSGQQHPHGPGPDHPGSAQQRDAVHPRHSQVGDQSDKLALLE